MSEENIIDLSQNPPAKQMQAQQALRTLSAGFIHVMEFLLQHGIPQDIAMECFRIGVAHGLARRVDVFAPNGQIHMQFINPYPEHVPQNSPSSGEVH